MKPRKPFDWLDQALFTVIFALAIFICVAPWLWQGVAMNRLGIDGLFIEVLTIWAFRAHRSRT